MIDVTQILSQINQGDPSAAEQLLPLVYDELRKLAAAKLVREKPEQTLQATALVHEAYLKLVGVEVQSAFPRLTDSSCVEHFRLRSCIIRNSNILLPKRRFLT